MPASASALLASAGIRVASLDLCADEYLLLLARPREIAGVSRLSHDPADSPLWRGARRFPAHGGGLEQILGRRPTLLLATGGGGRGTAAIARKAGIRVLTLPNAQGIDDVEAAMVQVASALGHPARAEPWRRRLARLRAVPVPQRDTIFLGGGGMSVSPGSLAAQWMALGGFRQRPLRGGRATLELLATRPPAVLLRSSYRAGQVSLGQRWLDHPLARRSPARAVGTDGRAWTCAGPLMLGEIERLRGVR